VSELAPLYPASRRHLDALTGELGIHQHAMGVRPDPRHGTCTDDIARALEVDLLHARELGWAAVAGRAGRNLDYLAAALDGTTGRFRNFRASDGTWLRAPGSDDCHGRGLLALGHVIAEAPDPDLVSSAAGLFARALPVALELTSLRASASVLLGCVLAERVRPNVVPGSQVRRAADLLRARFPSTLGSTWPWPEPILAYENALPARAMIVAGRALGSVRIRDTGLAVLDWLIDVQTAADGHLSPIGNGWWRRDGHRSRFDQQPIEATALLLAAEAGLEATGARRYLIAMECSYAWFLGANDLRVDLADPRRGACCDGLTPDGVNTNKGAESTLMWLIAAEHIRHVRVAAPPAVATHGTAAGAGLLIAGAVG
jgi:hypothetical protein